MNIKRTDIDGGKLNEKEDKYLKLKKQNKMNHKRIKRHNKEKKKVEK